MTRRIGLIAALAVSVIGLRARAPISDGRVRGAGGARVGHVHVDCGR